MIKQPQILVLQEFHETKKLLDEATRRVTEIQYRKKTSLKYFDEKKKPSTEPTVKYMLPPDDYQELLIVPTMNEILSDKPPFLRPNIVNGTYEDARQYLDVNEFIVFLKVFHDSC